MKNKQSLFSEEVRRATYKKWVFKSTKPCSADKMAEAGFIFTGSSRDPDSVQCFFCDKPLDGWEDNDNPWVEHLKHASYCEFAKMQKAQADWTLDEFLNLYELYLQKLVENHFEDIKNQLRKKSEQARKELRSLK